MERRFRRGIQDVFEDAGDIGERFEKPNFRRQTIRFQTLDRQCGLRCRLHLWRVTWRREISRFRFAAFEMTMVLPDTQTVRFQISD